MKRLLTLAALIITSLNLHAQVSIGNTDPKAILDVTASNITAPLNTDGLLVPRVSAFPVTNPGTDQNGMLLYLTTTVGINTPGFYYWNQGTTSWQKLITNASNIDDHDFYEEGTTSAPSNISNDIFTFGNLAIGKNTADFNLDIMETNSTRTVNLSNSNSSGIISGIFNQIVGNMTTLDPQRGVYNLLSGNGNNSKMGVYNNITGTGTSSNRYGTYNALSNNSETTDHGTYNTITSSSISSFRAKYGVYNLINNGGTSDNYGVFNVLTGSSTRPQTGTYNWIINSSPSNNLSSYGVRNIMQLSGSGSQYGVSNEMSTATGNGIKTGVFNVINSPNDAPRYGVDNSFYGTGNGNHIGIYNRLQGSGTGTKTGTHNYIPSSAGGTHFGLYSYVPKPGSFSGFFIGDVAIGTQTYGAVTPDYYILPSSRGMANQVMQTDGAGNVTWQDPSALGVDDHDFYEEGTTTAPNSINDDIFTQGNIAIGKNMADHSLDIQTTTGSRSLNIDLDVSSTNDVYGINNDITNTGNGDTYGLYNLLTGSTASPGGTHFGVSNLFNNAPANTGTFGIGIKNEMTNQFMGSKIGLQNIFNSSSGLATGVENTISINDGTLNGVYNALSGSGNSTIYGFRSQISGSSIGTHYGVHSSIDINVVGPQIGVYSEAIRATGMTYAGYFRGKVGIGTTTFTSGTPDFYILPESRGTNNQIMQTDATGNVNWVDPNTISSDDQNLTGASLTGTTLQIDIENGTSTSVDLSPLSFWSRTGTNLDVATVGDDINFTSDQTSITFPAPGATPSSMIYMFNSGTNNTDRMVLSHSSGFPDFGLEYEDATDSFIFRGGATERVEIDLFGGFPLRVYGTARAVNFQSDTATYPDYVFEAYFDGVSKLNKNYIFKPLNEVEAFIKTNGHLPGVTSYKEVKENDMSINLAKTSVTNLEKIEELFIYAIELKKENDTLKEEQKRLEKRLEKIEALLLKKD